MKSILYKKPLKGQAVIELAIALPILLVVVFGIIEFGRIFNAYMIISNASREGARYAAIGNSGNSVRSSIAQKTSTLDSSRLTVGITPENTRIHGETVIIKIDYDIKMLTPVVGSIISNTGYYHIKSETQMRIE